MTNQRPHRRLRTRAVLERTGLGLTTLNEKLRTGQFPPPIERTAASRSWLECDVEAWVLGQWPASDSNDDAA